MATFDAGSIQATATLDKSEFVRELQEMKRSGEEFSRQVFTPKVSLDTAAARLEIARVKAELASISSANAAIRISSTGASNISSVQAQINAINGQTAKARVELDGATSVINYLRVIRRDLAWIDGRRIRVTISTPGLDRTMAQLTALQARLNSLDGQTARIRTSSGGLGGAFSFLTGNALNMTAAVLAAGAALVPIGAVALAGAAGLASMAVAAGGLTAVFGAALFGAVKNVNGLNKTLDQAEKNLKRQQAALLNLKPGTDAYANQLRKIEEAQDKVNEANAAFSPTQKAYAEQLDKMKSAWVSFIEKTEPDTLNVAKIALQAVVNILKAAPSLVHAVAPEFELVAKSLRGWTADGGLTRFFNYLRVSGIPILHSLILGAIRFSATGGLIIREFAPVALLMSKGLAEGAKNLARWGQGGGFIRFLGYVREVWPTVREFFVQIGTLVGHLIQALQPLGPEVLGSFGILIRVINAIPIPVLTQMIRLFLLWRTAILLWTAAVAAAAIITKIIEGITFAWRILSFVFAASPIGLVITAIVLLIGILVLAYFKIGWFRNFVNATWKLIQQGAIWLWEHGIKPAFHGIMAGVSALGVVFKWLYDHWIKPYLNFIFAAFGIWWKGVKVYFKLVEFAIRILAYVFKWIWDKYVYPIFVKSMIAGFQLWWKGVKLYFGLVWDIIKVLAVIVKWIWDKYVYPVFVKWMIAGFKLWWQGVKLYFGLVWDIFRTLAEKAKWVYDHGIKPAWDKVSDKTRALKDGVVKAFRDMKNGLGDAWGQIKKLVAAPINFVIKTVYDNGIRKLWNGVAKAVGQKGLNLPYINPVKFATGGPVTGGRAREDSVLSMLMPGEHVLTTDEVKSAGGHGNILAWRRMLTGKSRVQGANNTGRFGLGGFLGDVGGAITGAGKGAINLAKSGLNKLEDLALGALGVVADPILNSLKSAVSGTIGSSTQWRKLVSGAATSPIDWVKKWIHHSDDQNSGALLSGAVGGMGVKRWSGVVLQVLKMLHQPESLLNTVLRRMNQESGGNPTVVNRWDSNWKAGHPSVGLMQVIRGTFNANAGKYKNVGPKLYGVSVNPLANIYASMQYALHRYGSLANAFNRKGGYALGTDHASAGIRMVGENGPEAIPFGGAEKVISNATLTRALGALGQLGAGGRVSVNAPTTLVVRIGEKEFTAYLEGETRDTIKTVVGEAKASR